MWKTDRKSYHIINLPLTTLAPWPLEAMTITPHRTLRIFCSALFFDDFILDREKELWNKNGIVKIKKILRSHQSSPVYCQFVDCDSALSPGLCCCHGFHPNVRFLLFSEQDALMGFVPVPSRARGPENVLRTGACLVQTAHQRQWNSESGSHRRAYWSPSLSFSRCWVPLQLIDHTQLSPRAPPTF